jgi:hypothetical protein
LGATAAATGIALDGMLWLETGSEIDEIRERCTRRDICDTERLDELTDRVDSFRWPINGLIGGGVLLAATGLVTYWMDGDDRVSLGVAPERGGASARVMLRF